MRLEILGPLRVLDGSTSSSLSAPKIRTLLTVLLIRADRLVTNDQLVDELWLGDPPPRAIAALHVYVSQLRKFLRRPGPNGSAVITRPPGYLLRIGTDRLDAHEFQQRMNEARALYRERRAEPAAAAFASALALWHGRWPAGPAGPIVAGFGAALEEARLECAELLVQSLLILERYDECIERLRDVVAENPLRETPHRQLMVALYRSGRATDALRAYQNARELLEDVGLEPGKLLREAGDAIRTRAAVVSAPCPN